MAISWGNVGTAVSSSGSNPSLSPGSPTSDANSFNILHIGWKSSSVAEPSVSSSTGKWIRIGISDSAADVASGTDTGSTSTLIYYAIGTAPTGTTVQFTGTVGACMARTYNCSKAGTESWVFSYSTGSDEVSSVDFLAVTATNFLTVANDLIVTCTSTNGDLGTVSAEAITATGITFGSTTNRGDAATTTGDDMRLLCASTPTTSGTQSAPASYTHTNASLSQGTTFMVRLRVLANPSISILPVDEFAETAGYQITASGLTPYAQFAITATNQARVWDLRGGQLQAVTASSFVGYDFEFPFGISAGYGSQNITYTVTTYSEGQQVAVVSATTSQTPFAEWSANLASNSIPVALGPRSYLGVPRTPALNIPIYVQECEGYSRSGRVLSKSQVLGRPNPVVSLDVTSGREGTMTLLVPTANDIIGSQYVPTNIKEHIDVLEGAHVFLLRNLSPYTVGFEDIYFIIDSLSVKRVNRLADMMDAVGDPVIQIEITWTEVDSPPASDAVTIIDWQDILDTYVSWQAVKDSNVNWLDVLQNG